MHEADWKGSVVRKQPRLCERQPAVSPAICWPAWSIRLAFYAMNNRSKSSIAWHMTLDPELPLRPFRRWARSRTKSIAILEKSLSAGPDGSRPGAAAGCLLAAEQQLREGNTARARALYEGVLKWKLP